MNILYAASEALPFMASGGLADVAGSLPKALNALGHECRVVMPLYGTIHAKLREKMEFITHFDVKLSWRTQYCGIFKAVHEGVTYYAMLPAVEEDEETGEPVDVDADDEEYGLVIMKTVEENGEELLSTLDSDEEIEEVYNLFMERFFEDEDE